MDKMLCNSYGQLVYNIQVPEHVVDRQLIIKYKGEYYCYFDHIQYRRSTVYIIQSS